MPEIFTFRSRLPVSADEAFAWHARDGAFERLNPPWADVEVLERTGNILGGRVTLSLGLAGPLRVRWQLEHRDAIPGRQFCDVQVAGPMRTWRHVHRLEPDGPDACYLDDRLEYDLPAGVAGRAVGASAFRRQLEQLFTYRHAVTRADLSAHRNSVESVPMQIVVAGASGLIGSALIPLLTTGGHHVRRLVRGGSRGPTDIAWNPAEGTIDAQALAGCEAVVNLAGENIAGHRWTAATKERIRTSRIQSTQLLARTLAAMSPRPRVWVCASAIGYYGDRGEELLDEASAPGTGFLPDVCREWEAATRPAADAGIRVVNLRFGVVLSPAGGALASMLPPFRFGLGGRLGSGRQYMSWVSIDDAVGSAHHALVTDALNGPVNSVSPEPASNAEFTRTLARVLHRPAIFPVPAPMARLALGEMADALLLASARVHPARLLGSGYEFRYPGLEAALRHVLGRETQR